MSGKRPAEENPGYGQKAPLHSYTVRFDLPEDLLDYLKEWLEDNGAQSVQVKDEGETWNG